VRLAEAEFAAAAAQDRPGVVLLEWLQPLYVGGHWVPEMIQRAGGADLLGKAKTPSYRVSARDVIAAAPDVLFIAPCGYTKEQGRDEYRSITFPEGWQDIPAVRNGRVYALEANSYVSRPGPRLVTGIESMLKALHPEAQVPEKAAAAFLPIAGVHTRRTATA